jgi:hypothetical protein
MGLIKYPKQFNNSTFHNWGIKKCHAMKEKDPSAMLPSEIFQPSSLSSTTA